MVGPTARARPWLSYGVQIARQCTVGNAGITAARSTGLASSRVATRGSSPCALGVGRWGSRVARRTSSGLVLVMGCMVKGEGSVSGVGFGVWSLGLGF